MQSSAGCSDHSSLENVLCGKGCCPCKLQEKKYVYKVVAIVSYGQFCSLVHARKHIPWGLASDCFDSFFGIPHIL